MQLCDEFQNQIDEKKSHLVLFSIMNITIRQIQKNILMNITIRQILTKLEGNDIEKNEQHTVSTSNKKAKKVKVSPTYDTCIGEYLLERTIVMGHRFYEVGGPVPFLAAFISLVLPPGTHSLLGGQWASV